jgi:hypothetical protein
MIKPAHEYRVQCHPHYKWHIDVLIFRSVAELDRYKHSLHLMRPCRAFFVPGSNREFVNGKSVRGNYIGEIGFTIPWFRMSIITHECVHAGLAFMRKIGKRVDGRTEELYALAVGEMARLIVSGYDESKKDKKRKGN